MNKLLGQVVAEEKNLKRKGMIKAELQKVKNWTGRTDAEINNFEVRPVSEMGHVAGDCHMCTKKMGAREDLLKTESGIRESLANTITHEFWHAEDHTGSITAANKGNYYDGIIELRRKLKTGQPPVAAYVGKELAAQHLAAVVGDDNLIEMAKHGREAEVLITSAFVKKRVHQAIKPRTAQEEAKRLLKQAA